MAKVNSRGFLFNPHKREILLHLRDNKTPNDPNKWSCFGGGMEDGETPDQCFIREIKEELGVDFKIEDLKLLTTYYSPQFESEHWVFYIESSLLKSDMTLGEGADFDWVPAIKVLELDLSDSTRYDLTMFLNKLS